MPKSSAGVGDRPRPVSIRPMITVPGVGDDRTSGRGVVGGGDCGSDADGESDSHRFLRRCRGVGCQVPAQLSRGGSGWGGEVPRPALTAPSALTAGQACSMVTSNPSGWRWMRSMSELWNRPMRTMPSK